jgi:4-hydroxyphenylpyruvate dioxygenase-like putative hemolysin
LIFLSSIFLKIIKEVQMEKNSNKSEAGTNIIVQVAVAVRDIEKVVRRLADIFGMDEPEIVSAEGHTDIFRGKKTDSYVKLAYFPMGQVDLELIEPVGDDIAAGEYLQEHRGNGIQHISFMVDNIDKKIKYYKSKGLELTQITEFPGGRAAFLKIPEIGADIELLEGSDKPED